MELEIKKTVKLSANIKKENEVIMNITAEIASDGEGTTNQNKTTYNQRLYDENKKEVRTKIAEFDVMYYATEDQLIEEFGGEPAK